MLKVPAAFASAPSTKTEARAAKEAKTAAVQQHVKARIDMSADVAGAGLCPECRRPMLKAFANGHPVLVCDDHRIAIPVPDQGQQGDAPSI